MVYDQSVCFSYRLRAGYFVLLVLVFTWCCTVIKNVMHCTVSGTVGVWWFSGTTMTFASAFAYHLLMWTLIHIMLLLASAYWDK